MVLTAQALSAAAIRPAAVQEDTSNHITASNEFCLSAQKKEPQ